MRVARLEIFGFKSFLESLTLPLEVGITGVVGPNGCGKSNIVDALRWIMGETRAKTLRGDVLEDVIFNGTDKLKPLGLAEASLTLRASGSNFFSDLKEIEELESELFECLEGEAQAVEAIAIPEQAATHERASGERPHLTVIAGRLGETPAADQQHSKSESEQQEVQDKAEAAPKLNQPTPLFTRFAWLKPLSEVRVTRRLYRSGESEFFINRVPCRLKDIKDLFRATGIGARSHTIVAQGEVARIVTAKPEERRLILEEAAGVAGFRDRIGAATRKLDETQIDITRLEDIIKEVARQVTSLKRQAVRAKNRQELKAQISALELILAGNQVIDFKGKLKELNAELDLLREKEQSADSGLHKTQAREKELRAELMTLDVEGDEVRLKIDSLREEINSRTRMESDRRSRMGEVSALAVSALAEIDSLNERLEVLGRRAADCAESVKKHRNSDVAQTNNLELLEEQTNNFRQEFRQNEQKLREVRDELIGSQSQLQAAKQQLAELLPQVANTAEISNEQRQPLEAVLSSAELEGRVVAADLKVPFQPMLEVVAQEIVADPGLASKLQGVYLVESLEQALSFYESSDLRPSIALVTPRGEILCEHSYLALKQRGGISKARADIAALEEKTAEALNAQTFLIQQRDDAEDKLKQAESAKSAELARRAEIAAKLESEMRTLAQNEVDQENIRREISQAQDKLERLKAEKESLSKEVVVHADSFDQSEIEAEIAQLNQQYKEIEERRRQGRDELSKFASQVEASRDNLDESRQAISAMELEIQKLALELRGVKERLGIEHDPQEVEKVLGLVAEDQKLGSEEVQLKEDELQRLRARLHREGDVDPTSIERYEQEHARLLELEKQRTDLTQAALTLRRTIEKLTETSRRRFMSVFKAVSRNFSELAPRLFGGGKGELYLLDPDKPLDSGVEINIRPPGKKLKGIDLLSGGEKALCAVALIFSMFRERPSPLCVLDEVDAPLDEANLLRFLEMIREMSTRTQFLLITHNKQTMALADNLIGVTMQEPGASKVISVSLQEAINQAA